MKTSELITNALLEIGVIAEGEPASAAQLASALVVVARMINTAGATRTTIAEVRRQTPFTLTDGTASYTIGAGGAINIARPVWIDRAGFILDSAATDPLEIPITVFTLEQWAEVRLKTLDGSVLQGIYYDRAFSSGLGTIVCYPVPDGSTRQLVLYTPVALTGYTGLQTDYTFAPGYDEAWHYELSYRLQRPFGRPFDAELKHQRNDAWNTLAIANRPAMRMGIDASLIALTGARGGGVSRSQFESGDF